MYNFVQRGLYSKSFTSEKRRIEFICILLRTISCGFSPTVRPLTGTFVKTFRVLRNDAFYFLCFSKREFSNSVLSRGNDLKSRRVTCGCDDGLERLRTYDTEISNQLRNISEKDVSLLSDDF